MHIVAIVVGAIWILFWFCWLLAASTAKQGNNRWGRFAGARVALVVLVVLLLHLGLFKGKRTETTNPWLEGIGLAVFLLGLGLAIWARIYIGRNWGMPMTERAEPELVNTGPYSIIRHPIYSGIMLALIGTALAVALYFFVAVVVVGAYFIFSAVTEERNMTRLFPDAYPEYKRSTKMLIPYIF